MSDTEVQIYEDLMMRLTQTKRELSLAYTISLASRNVTNRKVKVTDLKNKKLILEDA